MNKTRPRILLLGKSGQLARALVRAVGKSGDFDLVQLGRPELDVTDAAALSEAILEGKPDILVNATAYTAVDRAEDEPEAAFAVNAAAPEAMGKAAAEIGCPVVHVSTDYVFSGEAARPWRPEDPTGPEGVYGASKLAGERALLAAQPQSVILRTGWLYAAQGANFLNTMLRLAESRDQLAVVDDQTGCPTLVDDLAEAILSVCRRVLAGEGRWGVYHYGGAGAVTWYDFAQAIFEEARDRGLPAAEVSRTTTAAFGARAPRPTYSVLDCSSLERDYGIGQKEWRGRLKQAMDWRGKGEAKG
ncbi:dTDP-4-dehydrorhamnose reductase [Limibacillus halophilus]